MLIQKTTEKLSSFLGIILALKQKHNLLWVNQI